MVFQRPRPNPPKGFGGAHAFGKYRMNMGLPGTSINAVRAAVDHGRISPPSKTTGWFNFVAASKEWKLNTGATKGPKPKKRVPVSGKSRGKSPKPSSSKPVLKLNPQIDDPDEELQEDEPDFGLLDPAKNPTARLTLARAEREEANAALATLQLHERAGSLVSLKMVQDAVQRIHRITRDALLTVPDRVASQVAASTKSAEVHEIILQEIRMALESLAKMPVEEFLEAKRAAAIRERDSKLKAAIKQ